MSVLGDALRKLFNTPVETTAIPQVTQPVASVMSISKLGKAEIVYSEAITQTKYWDSEGNTWTIGIGATDSEIADLVSWPLDKTLSLQEVFTLFSTSLVKYEAAINQVLLVPVTQVQFDALVSITYNIGVAAMQRSTFMKLINTQANLNDIIAAIRMWNIPKAIIERRAREISLYVTGRHNNIEMHGLLCPVIAGKEPVHGTLIDISGYL